MSLFWFDDDPSREDSAKNLNSDIDYDVRFVKLKNRKIENLLKDFLKDTEPNLILLDHSLVNAKSEIFKTGSSVAAAIREKWPRCPIVCITGTDIEEIDIRHKSAYELIRVVLP